MRIALLTTLAVMFATPAFATDSGDAAFALLSKYQTEARQTDYIKLNSAIDMADAMKIDAQLSEIYGAATTTREGLKVWEVENTGDGAKHTTIMCGPDGKGGIFITADRRGPTPFGAASRTAKIRSADPRPAVRSLPTPPRARSLERD